MISYAFPAKQNLQERQDLCNKFNVGDVIVTHLTGHKNVSKMYYLVVIFQSLAKVFGLAHQSAKPSAVHISTVVGIDAKKGRVLISEAMPGKGSGLRTIDLFEHNSSVLTKGRGYEYQVYRATPAHEATAQKAAQIGLRLSPKASYLLTEEEKEQKANAKHFHPKYSFILGLKGIFTKNKTFHFDAQKRLFKGMLEEHLKLPYSIGVKKARQIHCSAFGAQIFQKAAAEQAWHELLEDNPQIKTDIKNFENQIATQRSHKGISKWSKEMAEKYGDKMEKKLGHFAIDFKHMTPQDLVHFLEVNDVAQNTFNLTAPK